MNQVDALKSAFVVAARDGHTELIELLLEAGADIHAWHDVALRCAAESGHIEAVTFLLSKGADAHAMDDEALRFAEEHGHDKVVTILRAWPGKKTPEQPPPRL